MQGYCVAVADNNLLFMTWELVRQCLSAFNFNLYSVSILPLQAFRLVLSSNNNNMVANQFYFSFNY